MVARRPFVTGLLGGLAATMRSAAVLADDTAAPAQAGADLVRLRRNVWRNDDSPEKFIWGYTDRHSATIGQTFDLMLSTGPDGGDVRGRVEVYRIGHYPDGEGNGDRKLVWTSQPVTVPACPVQITAAAVGAGWPTALEQIGTPGWQPGYHAIDFVREGDHERDADVAFIVIVSPERDGDILLELSTNTWQAYNEWGGYSLYASDFLGAAAQVVSFDRPTDPMFYDYEYYLVIWLEKFCSERGLKLHYATDFDVHSDRRFSENYRLFLSGPHNEYWSREQFEAIHHRIFTLGRNTIFLGANAAYWQIRYGDLHQGADPDNRGRQLVCYKSLDDPTRYRGPRSAAFNHITMRFRDGRRFPETMLAGVAYQSWFARNTPAKPRYAYRVVANDLPFFAGTGYAVGDAVADVVGYEWDNRDPEGDGRRLWDAQASQVPPIPPDAIKVLFRGEPVDVDGRRGTAEAVYFRSSAGAKVFTAGSIYWVLGLNKPGYEQPVFARFNAQLFHDFLRTE